MKYLDPTVRKYFDRSYRWVMGSENVSVTAQGTEDGETLGKFKGEGFGCLKGCYDII